MLALLRFRGGGQPHGLELHPRFPHWPFDAGGRGMAADDHGNRLFWKDKTSSRPLEIAASEWQRLPGPEKREVL